MWYNHHYDSQVSPKKSHDNIQFQNVLSKTCGWHHLKDKCTLVKNRSQALKKFLAQEGAQFQFFSWPMDTEWQVVDAEWTAQKEADKLYRQGKLSGVYAKQAWYCVCQVSSVTTTRWSSIIKDVEWAWQYTPPSCPYVLSSLDFFLCQVHSAPTACHSAYIVSRKTDTQHLLVLRKLFRDVIFSHGIKLWGRISTMN